MTRILLLSLTALLAVPAFPSQDRLTDTEKIELVRNLTAEYATTKETLPRSKKPLDFDISGKYDQAKWAALVRDNGPAARLGDQVQITKLVIEKERLLFEINGGNKNNAHWYDHVSVGMGGTMSPVGKGNPNGTAGTIVALDFHKPIGELDSVEIKKMLLPLFDFDKHSATKLYSETLPPEIRKAIADKRAQAGMDRDQVLMALGHPDRKLRETKDGDELEDWIYGHPPGKITFVTFNGSKVVTVKDSYAQLGAGQANPIESPR